MGEEVVADGGVGIEDGVREEDGVVAEGYVVHDDGVGADMRVGANLCGGGYDGCWVNAGGVGRGCIEELDGSGKGEVGIRDAESGGGDLGEVGFDYDGGGLGGAGQGDVLGGSRRR